MSATIAYVILYVAASTAWRPGRPHWPIAITLSWFTISTVAASHPIPAWLTYVVTATYPATIVAAAWAAGQSKARPYFGLLFAAGAVVATLIGAGADLVGKFGQCMAYFWLVCAVVGGAALHRSDAPPATRAVLTLLVGALPCEALGWLSWAAGFDDGYAFSRMVTNISFLAIIGIQATEGARWLPRWATLHGHPLARIREWARTWRRTELDDQTTKVDPRG